MSIVLSLILLRKPVEILKESFAEPVDANGYAETVNIVEESGRARRALPYEAVQWVRVSKAGRRVFGIVSFLKNPEESLEERERMLKAVDAETGRLNPNLDVSVLFRSG